MCWEADGIQQSVMVKLGNDRTHSVIAQTARMIGLPYFVVFMSGTADKQKNLFYSLTIRK